MNMVDNNSKNIISLFPKAIGKYKFDGEFDRSIIDFILNQETIQNVGNKTTKNKYILNEKPFEDIKNFCDECISKYFQEIYQANDLEIYITQSWCNITEKNGFHHRHRHPNSFISGVFYLETVSEKDKICFYNDYEYDRLYVHPNQWNWWNALSWWLEAERKVLYLFQSSLIHDVPAIEHETRRISLSFNTFLKGNLGNYDGSTQLIL